MYADITNPNPNPNPKPNPNPHPPFLTFNEPFCMCVFGKVSLTSRMRNMCSFISYLGRAQPPLSLLIFWSICPQGRNSSCSPWDPSIPCLIGMVQGFRPQTSILKSLTLEVAVPGLWRATLLDLQWQTLATFIQCFTTQALSWAMMPRSPRQVVMTHLATLLNWVTVAWMVCAMCSFPNVFSGTRWSPGTEREPPS